MGGKCWKKIFEIWLWYLGMVITYPCWIFCRFLSHEDEGHKKVKVYHKVPLVHMRNNLRRTNVYFHFTISNVNCIIFLDCTVGMILVCTNHTCFVSLFIINETKMLNGIFARKSFSHFTHRSSTVLINKTINIQSQQ